MPPFYSEDVQEMYQKIVNDPIDFSEIRDPETRSIISAFLNRDPDKRLTDPGKIKQHPYFNRIDWAKMNEKELDPVWSPPVPDDEDTSQFDDDFTNLPINSVPNGSLLGQTLQEPFKDFSYSSSHMTTRVAD